MPFEVSWPGSDKPCGQISRDRECVASRAQYAVQSAYPGMMKRRIQAGQRAKRSGRPIGDGVQARPIAPNHDQGFNLRAQCIGDMVQQGSAAKQCRGLVCTKAARLPAGNNGSKNAQALYPTFNAKAAHTAATIIAITRISGHGMNPTASGFMRLARRRSPHVASPATANAVTHPLQSTCCNQSSFQAKAATTIESRG